MSAHATQSRDPQPAAAAPAASAWSALRHPVFRAIWIATVASNIGTWMQDVGSAWFSGDESAKGAIAPRQLADLAVLSGDYFNVPEDQIKRLESVLTVVGGKVVYAAGDFAQHDPGAPPVLPEWSPVAHYGGYQNPSLSSAAFHGGPVACAHGSAGRERDGIGTFGLASLAEGFLGAGCSCWAF